MAKLLTDIEISDILFTDIPNLDEPSDASDADDDFDDLVENDVRSTTILDINTFDVVFNESLNEQNPDESCASSPGTNSCLATETSHQRTRRVPKPMEPDRKWRKKDHDTTLPPYNHPEGNLVLQLQNVAVHVSSHVTFHLTADGIVVCQVPGENSLYI